MLEKQTFFHKSSKSYDMKEQILSSFVGILINGKVSWKYHLRCLENKITKGILMYKVKPFLNKALSLDICYWHIHLNYFLSYLGFLSQTFTIHRTAGEGDGYLFNSSLPLPLASQTLRYQPAITEESSSLHIASRRTRLWKPCMVQYKQIKFIKT